MATGRLAVLSNVNMNMVIRMLQKQAEVYDAEGYGNELGALLNPASSYHAFQPDITFLIMDLAELLERISPYFLNDVQVFGVAFAGAAVFLALIAMVYRRREI